MMKFSRAMQNAFMELINQVCTIVTTSGVVHHDVKVLHVDVEGSYVDVQTAKRRARIRLDCVEAVTYDAN